MANYMITISLDSNNNFVYSPSTLRVSAGDVIQWQSTMPFALMFLDRTPLGHMVVWASTGNLSTPPFTVTPGVNGHYHYGVATWDGTRVWIDAGCPDIICN